MSRHRAFLRAPIRRTANHPSVETSMIYRTTLGVFIPLIILLAAGRSNDDGLTNPPATGTIRGTVTTSAGQPVVGASVVTTPATQAKVTGADGTYSIADVSAGTYVIAVTKMGFNPGSA